MNIVRSVNQRSRAIIQHEFNSPLCLAQVSAIFVSFISNCTFSLRVKNRFKHKENFLDHLRVVLVKVYFEFSIARLLVFALIFHITHLIIKSSR